jgi:hypothetical protein
MIFKKAQIEFPSNIFPFEKTLSRHNKILDRVLVCIWIRKRSEIQAPNLKL